jgi:hypothetical protein
MRARSMAENLSGLGKDAASAAQPSLSSKGVTA